MAKIDVNIQGADSVKTLIELLHQYKDDLPKELNDKLIESSDCAVFEYDRDKLSSLGVNPDKVFSLADKVEVKKLISVNKILKRLTVFIDEDIKEKSFSEGYLYPKSFTMLDEHGNTLVNW